MTEIVKTGVQSKVFHAGATFVLPVPAQGLGPLLGAAYLLTDRAYVSLAGNRKKALEVTLLWKEPGRPGQELAEQFSRELDTQKVRWAMAESNAPIRGHILALARAAAEANRR